MPAIPITIITGFLGSGKTTLLLNLLPQIHSQSPNYKVALLKNEFGDLAIDSQLVGSSSISGVREILNGCICCNLVGSLSTALAELTDSISPDRVVIETSGSAFPATLAMEVNRLARETHDKYVLDGVVTVIDVENWKGYEDTSFTARLQARFTDLVVFNKWEDVGERRWDECLDRLGDLEVETAWVKSRRGWVDMNVIFGLDRALARDLEKAVEIECHHQNSLKHNADDNHQKEVDVLSVTLSEVHSADSNSSSTTVSLPSPQKSGVDTTALLKFLQTAPRDEIYRIKSIFTSNTILPSSTSISSSSPVDSTLSSCTGPSKYILNWSFGRWTCTPFSPADSSTAGANAEHLSSSSVGQGEVLLRMVLILSPGLGKNWKKRLEDGKLVRIDCNLCEDVKQNLSIISIT